MLTIEKHPTTVQKSATLVGAFLFGLIGSVGILSTIDPRSNATVARTAESSFAPISVKQAEQAPAEAQPSSDEAKPAQGEAPTSTQPTAVQHTNAPAPSAPTPTPVQAQPESAPVETPAEEAPTEDAPNEDEENGGLLRNLPILGPLFP